MVPFLRFLCRSRARGQANASTAPRLLVSPAQASPSRQPGSETPRTPKTPAAASPSGTPGMAGAAASGSWPAEAGQRSGESSREPEGPLPVLLGRTRLGSAMGPPHGGGQEQHWHTPGRHAGPLPVLLGRTRLPASARASRGLATAAAAAAGPEGGRPRSSGAEPAHGAPPALLGHAPCPGPPGQHGDRPESKGCVEKSDESPNAIALAHSAREAHLERLFRLARRPTVVHV
mmetsp:Transcript_140107/g.390586  ORF Transcript_140107/g.390586 Transcript_140107/m.390586 type:complete len:232 (-) Transcript_140107:72-767(-)